MTRARQARRDAIKDQIETFLNIKGKEMPSAKEELGSIFEHSKTLEHSDFFATLHRNREMKTSSNGAVDAETGSGIGTGTGNETGIVDPVVVHVEPEEIEEAYSDFTEKLQSFYPECKKFV